MRFRSRFAGVVLAFLHVACGSGSRRVPVSSPQAVSASWDVVIEDDRTFRLPDGWSTTNVDLPTTLEVVDGDGSQLRVVDGRIDEPRSFSIRACHAQDGCAAAQLVVAPRPPEPVAIVSESGDSMQVTLGDPTVADPDLQPLIEQLQAERCLAGDTHCLLTVDSSFASSGGAPPPRRPTVDRALLERLLGVRRFFVLGDGQVTAPTGFQFCGDAPVIAAGLEAPSHHRVRMAPDDGDCAQQDASFDAEVVALPAAGLTAWAAATATGEVVDARTLRLKFPGNLAAARANVSVHLPGAADVAGEWVSGADCPGGYCYRLHADRPLLPAGGETTVRLRLLNARSDEALYATDGNRLGPASRQLTISGFRTPVIPWEVQPRDFDQARGREARLEVVDPILAALGVGERDAFCRVGNNDPSCGEVNGVDGHPDRRVVRIQGSRADALRRPGGELLVGIQADGFANDRIYVRFHVGDCRYSARQLTALYDQMPGTVLLWVFSNSGACLRRSLDVRTATNDEFQLQGSRWWSVRSVDASSIDGARQPDGSQGRILALEVAKVALGARRTPDLSFHHTTDTPALDRLGNPVTFSLRLRRAFEVSTSTVDIEVIPATGREPEDDTVWLPRQEALVLDHRNFVELPYLEGYDQPYRVHAQTSGLAPCVDAGVLGSTDEHEHSRQASPGSTALPARQQLDRERGRRLLYCGIPGQEASEIRLEAELEAPASRVLAGVIGLPEELDAPILVGRREFDLPRPIRRLYQPWALGNTTALVCDSTANDYRLGNQGVIIGTAEAPEPMRRNEYRHCALRVALPTEQACDTEPETLFRRTGAQHLEILVQREGQAAQSVGTVQLDAGSVAAGAGVICTARHTPEWRWDTPASVRTAANDDDDQDDDRDQEPVPSAEGAAGGYLWIPLPDLVHSQESSLEDFKTITIEVRHSAAATRFAAIGPNPHVPSGYLANLTAGAGATFITRLRPRNGLTSAFYDYGHTSAIGPHYSFDVLAGFSALRTPRAGWGIPTSSMFDSVETFNFQYGVAVSLEPWNYSTGSQALPVANPQIQMGLLLPTSFDRETVFHSLSFIVGLGLRLTPTPRVTAGVDTTINATAWWEISAGPRDTVHHALLLGFNGTIKTD